MKKLLKSKKALSPVVAAIILIAVTVAVSIAVAAWMGALTFTFMKTEEIKITSMTFTNPNPTNTNGTSITLKVTNTGTGKVTIADAKVNDASKSFTGTETYEAGDPGTIVVTCDWTAGNKYKVSLISATGTPVGAYEATA